VPRPIKQIPGTERIARYCSGTAVDDITGIILPAAFEPRAEDRGDLSVAHTACAIRLETGSDEHDRIRRNLRRQSLTLSRSGQISVLEVAPVRRVTLGKRRLRVLPDPTDDNDCHAVIRLGTRSERDYLRVAMRLARIANRSVKFQGSL
jgi:hypothetical protein